MTDVTYRLTGFITVTDVTDADIRNINTTLSTPFYHIFSNQASPVPLSMFRLRRSEETPTEARLEASKESVEFTRYINTVNLSALTDGVVDRNAVRSAHPSMLSTLTADPYRELRQVVELLDLYGVTVQGGYFVCSTKLGSGETTQDYSENTREITRCLDINSREETTVNTHYVVKETGRTLEDSEGSPLDVDTSTCIAFTVTY